MLIKYHRWGSFANGEEGYEELDAPVSYRIGLKTWANWVDSTIDPNRTRVFFTTMSPTHQRFVRPYSSLIFHFFINTQIQLLSNLIFNLIHTIFVSNLQECRLGQREWNKMLQRDKTSHEKMALGNWIRFEDDERSEQRSAEDESAGDVHQHNAVIRVQNRCTLINIHRIGRGIVERRTKGGSIAFCRLHTLVFTWCSWYMESNFLCSLVTMIIELRICKSPNELNIPSWFPNLCAIFFFFSFVTNLKQFKS